MTLLGQLAHSQQGSEFPFWVALEAGLLRTKLIPQQRREFAGGEQLGAGVNMELSCAPIAAAGTESVEMAWLEENARELGQYKGEWLLIQGRQLVVHSEDFAEVRAAIRERRVRSPFVYYVPMDEESNSVTI